MMTEILTPLLAKLESLLLAEIPPAVRNSNFEERTYCLRIAYFGSDTEGDRVPVITLVRESARIAFLQEYGREAPYYIWCKDEVESPQQSYDVPFDDETVTLLCREIYPVLDRVGLSVFREMINRVATRLNSFDWRTLTNATDDFVVFPADWSHDTNDFEHMHCIPKEKLDLLRSRNLLGSDEMHVLKE